MKTAFLLKLLCKGSTGSKVYPSKSNFMAVTWEWSNDQNQVIVQSTGWSSLHHQPIHYVQLLINYTPLINISTWITKLSWHQTVLRSITSAGMYCRLPCCRDFFCKYTQFYKLSFERITDSYIATVFTWSCCWLFIYSQYLDVMLM